MKRVLILVGWCGFSLDCLAQPAAAWNKVQIVDPEGNPTAYEKVAIVREDGSYVNVADPVYEAGEIDQMFFNPTANPSFNGADWVGNLFDPFWVNLFYLTDTWSLVSWFGFGDMVWQNGVNFIGFNTNIQDLDDNVLTGDVTLTSGNNAAPNQTASSGDNLMTRDLGDARWERQRLIFTGGQLVSAGSSCSVVVDGDGPGSSWFGHGLAGAVFPDAATNNVTIPLPVWKDATSVTLRLHLSRNGGTASNVATRWHIRWGSRNWTAGNEEQTGVNIGVLASINQTLSFTSTSDATVNKWFDVTVPMNPGTDMNHPTWITLSRLGTDGADTLDASVYLWLVEVTRN